MFRFKASDLRQKIALSGRIVNLKFLPMTTFRFLIFLFLLGILGCRPGSQRQEPAKRPSAEERARQRVERMQEELGLTEQQQKELAAWYTGFFKKQQPETASGKPDRAAMRVAVKKSREEEETRLREVLTGQQYEMFRKKEAARREKHLHRSGRHPGDSPQGRAER